MSEAPTPAPVRPAFRPRWRLLLPALLLAAFLAGLAIYYAVGRAPMPRASAEPPPPAPAPDDPPTPAPKHLHPAPELDGGVAWLNTASPLQLKDLRGKIVVLDFWTLCCINCIHTLPDLAKLEKKYANELVVIGVHSPKFDNEKDTESIRKAILRYEITHPVVNDADMTIWNAYDVSSWPTLVLIDPEGNLVARGSGEGLYDALDENIARLIKESPREEDAQREAAQVRAGPFTETGASPLFFPGKVLADEAGQAPVHRRQHAPPYCHYGPGRQEDRRRRHRRARHGRRRLRQGPVQRPARHGPRRRHALRRRPQEPPDPRPRPQGADGEDRGRHRRAGRGPRVRRRRR